MPDEPAPEAAPVSRPALSRPRLIAIGCLVGGALLGALGVPTVLARFEEPETPVAAEGSPKVAETPKGIPLDQPIKVMVNVADEHARRVLKADIIVEAKDSATRRQLQARAVEIKHWLISLLSEKRLKDLEGTDAKDALRREIKLCVNERLGIPDAIVQVYFDQFIVQ